MTEKRPACSFLLLIMTLILSLSCSERKPDAQTAEKPLSLTVYSGRSESLVEPIIEQFQAATGIQTQVKYGGTAELAAALLEEGDRTLADLFFAQDPGGLGAVEGMLAPLPADISDLVARRYRSPEGKWVGLSGRARTVVYNTNKLGEGDLPRDIWGFTDPKWKGRIGWSPTNASFQAMLTAMIKLWGEEKTAAWLAGIQANEAKIYPNNTSIVSAVGSGEVEVGFVNHYYLFRFLAEQGESFPVRNYHPADGGPGAIILVAGAGILESSRNKEAGERFLRFMLSPVAQQYFTGQSYEYPVIDGVNTNRLLTPVSEIKSPEISLRDLSNPNAAVELLRKSGIIP
ncbi:MAG: iron ABC transporter substrate-binding protein [Deltaproteobacteria bacterium]